MNDPQRTTSDGFALFETAIGQCGIAWRGERVTALALPASDANRTHARLRRAARGPEAAPPLEIELAGRRIAALLAGERVGLDEVKVDHDEVPDFDRRVYAALRSVPSGKTVTYGELARRVGESARARDVGGALGRNPTPLIVPCHRVTAANGGLGGFSAPGGRQTKRQLLEIEGALATRAEALFTV